MYYKQSTGEVIVRKSISNVSWVKWVHHSQGPTCCQECLKLDGCLFLESRAPIWPHHPHCHCTLDPVDYSTVLLVAIAQSDYGKFDPYLFNTQGRHPHGKETSLNSLPKSFCRNSLILSEFALRIGTGDWIKPLCI